MRTISVLIDIGEDKHLSQQLVQPGDDRLWIMDYPNTVILDDFVMTGYTIQFHGYHEHKALRLLNKGEIERCGA